jgi:lambda family phage portal protein
MASKKRRAVNASKGGRFSAKEKKEIVKHIISEVLGSSRKGGAKASTGSFNNVGSARRGRSYKGARQDKYNENWSVSNETADQEMMWGDLVNLRFRSRQLCKDNPIAEGTVITFQQMVVGDGPVIRSKAIDPKVREQIQAVINPALENCDATGEKDLVQVCKNAVTSMCEDGDVGVILPMDRSADPSTVQTRLDLIEADRIMTPMGMTNTPIRHGVVYSSAGKIEGYWVRKIGLSEQEHTYGYSVNLSKDNFIYFPRNKNGRLSAWLLKRPEGIERPGQSRQVPLFSSCIDALKDMEDLLDVTIVGMRAAACIMGVIESDNAEEIYDAMGYDEGDAKELTDKYGYSYSKMQPGSMLPLRKGEKVELLDPKRNGAEVEPLILRLCHFISMKVRIPYPVLFLDLSQVNYSSYRGGILEARKMLKGYRKMLSSKLVIPYLSAVIREAWLKGLIPAAKELTPDMLVPRIDWPSWGMIDPVKETNAAIKGIAAGLTSPQRDAAERGEDAFEILEENAQYYEKKKEVYTKHNVVEFMGTGTDEGAKNPDPTADPIPDGGDNAP